MSSKVQSLIFPSFPISPQSPHETVKIGGQESQRTQVRQNIFLNVQNEDVANTWSEVFRNRAKRQSRFKALDQSEKKFITPSPSGPVKGFSLSSTTDKQRSISFKAYSIARNAKEKKEPTRTCCRQRAVECPPSTSSVIN